MKSLQESLFDHDLIQKKIGTLDAIVVCLDNFIKQKSPSMKDWMDCLDDIKKAIDYKRHFSGLSRQTGWDLLRHDMPNKIKADELYVSFGITPALYLMARNLIGDKEYSTEACPLVVIRYSDQLGTIYSDVYRTGTGTYSYKAEINANKGKFNWYKINPKETKSFVDNIFNQIEQVF